MSNDQELLTLCRTYSQITNNLRWLDSLDTVEFNSRNSDDLNQFTYLHASVLKLIAETPAITVEGRKAKAVVCSAVIAGLGVHHEYGSTEIALMRSMMADVIAGASVEEMVQ